MRGFALRTLATRATLTAVSLAISSHARQLLQLAGTPIVSNITNVDAAGSASMQKLAGDFVTINSQLPANVHVDCHFGPQYDGPASNSEAASEYLKAIRYKSGDNYMPVTPKGNDDPKFKTIHNESWGLGISWSGKCILKDNVPTCEFTFGPFSRASGTLTIRNPGPADIKFIDCAVGMDGTLFNSTTCFQESDLTRLNMAVGYKEQDISAITFYSRFQDTSASGPPAIYNLAYRCQFLFNAFEVFNPLGNVVGLDPRISSFLPNLPGGGVVGSGGQVGPPGNGGYSGPGQLPGLKGTPSPP